MGIGEGPGTDSHAVNLRLKIQMGTELLDVRRGRINVETSVLARIAITPAGELDQLLPDVWRREATAPHPRTETSPLASSTRST